MNPDSAVKLRSAEARWNTGPTVKSHSHFALTHFAVTSFNIHQSTADRCLLKRQKPIDFATEGFRLAFPAERNCGIRDENILQKYGQI
jgi:hypothetical protein